ncbi:MAG: phage head closure protein [Desulfarculus sp.]|nr:phage head closure protein [Desulfarculus sp.]
MRAGALRHRVAIQQPVTSTPEGQAEPVVTYVPFALDAWASVEPLNGREFFAAGGRQAEVSHRVRLRYLAGVKADMRVLHEGRALDIKAVIDPQERHRELVLMCLELQP